MTHGGVETFVPQSIKPYLTYSVALHVLGAVAALRLAAGFAVAPSQVYNIDFVGPSATIQSMSVQEAAAPTATTAPQTAAEVKPPPENSDFDEFGRRKHKRFVLPRPSLLKGFQSFKEEPAAEEAPAEKSAPTASASSASGAGGGGAPGAGIATDMPNFPYPWYISQVRSALWNMWSSRMPKVTGQCVIVFSIRPNGTVVDMRAEESSGDSSFDLTAMSAVQDAAPFPGLPKGFHEPFLKVHITLRSQ